MDDTRSRGCPIRTISLEILLQIQQYLTTQELGMLRLTCRSFETSLFHAYVNEFFGRMQFMMTEHSLQTLMDISNSRLGSHVRRVDFSIDRVINFYDELNDEKELMLREAYASSFMLQHTGYHRDMMTAAFCNLPNLETVAIRDFDSQRRSREGMNRGWHSCGYMKAWDETGVQMGQGNAPEYYSQVFAAVLYALGATKGNLKGLEIMSRHFNHLRDFAFRIPKFMEPNVLPVLKGLEKLHLSLSLPWREQSITISQTIPDLFIRKFLAHANNIKDLRINGIGTARDGVDHLFDWMIEDDGHLDGITFSMPKLEAFSLGTTSIDSARLYRLIAKFAPSLKRLDLWRVTMVQHVPPGSPTTSRNVGSWKHFLNRLADMPDLELKHFMMGNVMQKAQLDDALPARLTFGGSNCTPEYRRDRGTWRTFIDEIRSQLKL